MPLIAESVKLTSKMRPLKPNNKIEESFLTEIHKHLSNSLNRDFKFDITRSDNVFIHEEMQRVDNRIVAHIKEYSKIDIVVTFSILDGITVSLHLVYEKRKVFKKDILKKGRLVAGLITFLSFYAKLPKQIFLHVYLTSLKKKLQTGTTIGFFNVNTGFTTANGNSIFIFRKEEWFKVLIHESFHCFGLDFTTNNHVVDRYKNIFPINSTFLIYEAYTEFWAEVINIAVFAFHSEKQLFSKKFKYYLGIEQKYKILQMTKVLHHMNNLSYKDLIFDINPERFQEESNVFSYYVLTTILLCAFQDFLYWCRIHNETNLLMSRKDMQYCNELYVFFRAHYRDAILLKDFPFLAFGNSLRMTSIEYD